jgi:ubiquinone/menaquinone biosynthesis C-methylase UbiE
VTGLTHKFNKNNRHKLDNEQRRQVMPPVKTLEMLGFTSGVDMADIGCGIGYFSIPAAEIAGASSKIYAMDITVEMLDEVEKKALEAGLSNIHNIMVDEYDLKLDDQSVGFALLSNVLHEIGDKKRYLSEICRILRNGGKLAIIEWAKIDGESGPPVEHRISYEEVAELFSKNGFENFMKFSIGQDFYGITAIKL